MTESRHEVIARCAMAVVLLASATLLAVREGRGQAPGRVYRIAFLSILDSSELTEPPFRAFVQALRDLGWIEGRNIAIEYHWGEGNADRLPALAADLVRRKPDVIFTTGTPATAAAKFRRGSFSISCRHGAYHSSNPSARLLRCLTIRGEGVPFDQNHLKREHLVAGVGSRPKVRESRGRPPERLVGRCENACDVSRTLHAPKFTLAAP